MAKCDLNKAASNFIEIALWHVCSAVNLPHILGTLYYKNTYGGLPLGIANSY